VIPVPIFCDKDDKTYWDFCVHSGMHSSLMRDFHHIWKIIKNEIKSFEYLMITGHSLGGGISILFALETIINRYLPSNKQISVVTFGSPSVISYEKEFDQLSKKSKLILSELHNVCHCFVNKFDPVPRLPTRSEWIMTVIPYALRRVVREKIASSSMIPSLWSKIINYGAKSAHMHFVKTAGRYMDVLQSYHPLGTFYFMTQEQDEPHITKNPKAIEDILGYVPLHKIIDSSGNAIRVGHSYTASKIDGIDDNRFSLQYLRDLTELIYEEEGKGNNEEDTESVVSGLDNDLIDLLTVHNDYDGEWNRYQCIYTIMESDDENVMKLIQNRKLSGKDWLQLVGNHVIGEYIELFSSINIESLSLGEIDTFQKLYAEFSESRGNIKDKSIIRSIKNQTSKMWKTIKQISTPKSTNRVQKSSKSSRSISSSQINK